ncbi:MAG: sigma-70 family RNA polymerase sigma factor, partial [Clostridiales bacterium]
MERLTDEQLVSLCLKGEKQAFEVIVNRYQKQIFSLAYRLGGDYDEAKDLAQEAFLRIYQELFRFDNQRKFFPWMYRVAHNCCINTLNKKPKNNLSLDDSIEYSAEYHNEAGSYLDNPENSYQKEEQSQLIREALCQLPDQFRIPLTLKYIDGLSYKEISQKTD